MKLGTRVILFLAATMLGCSGDSDTDDSAGTVASATEGDSETEADSATANDSATEGETDAVDPHGTITECELGASEACDEGVRFCFGVDEQVTTHAVWGPCGDCIPGESQACEEPGFIAHCDAEALSSSFPDPEAPPTWGACVEIEPE